MRLEQTGASLRPRRPWEGIDLGFALGRDWFPSLWILWWMTALPCALLLLVLTGGRADLWLVAVWWLKPLYEAPLQYWASRALLGQRLPASQMPRIMRAAFSRRILPLLLWRRLGTRRAFLMPVTLLEGLSGRPARRRRAVLSADQGAPRWLTLICYHFEAILWAGALIAIAFMVPEGMPRLDLAEALTASDSWPYWISAVAYLLAFSVMAPFYVCGGFSLYLTRRTELEAWDLEVAFRRARDDQADRAARVRSKRLAGLLTLGLVLSVSSLCAETRSLPDPDQAQRLIDEVLDDDAFGGTRELTLWLPRESAPQESVERPTWPIDLSRLAVMLALVLKWSLLVLAVAALTWLVLRLVQTWRSGSRVKRRPGRRRTGSLAGRLEPAGASGDIPATIRGYIGAGKHRAALALLYRASIAALSRQGVEIPDGATEGDCLALAEQTLPARRAAVMTRLTAQWSRVAYAHQEPAPESIIALLDAWYDVQAVPTASHRRQGPGSAVKA